MVSHEMVMHIIILFSCYISLIFPIATKLLHSSIIKKLIYMSIINNMYCYASLTRL